MSGVLRRRVSLTSACLLFVLHSAMGRLSVFTANRPVLSASTLSTSEYLDRPTESDASLLQLPLLSPPAGPPKSSSIVPSRSFHPKASPNQLQDLVVPQVVGDLAGRRKGTREVRSTTTSNRSSHFLLLYLTVGFPPPTNLPNPTSKPPPNKSTFTTLNLSVPHHPPSFPTPPTPRGLRLSSPPLILPTTTPPILHPYIIPKLCSPTRSRSPGRAVTSREGDQLQRRGPQKLASLLRWI